MHPNIKFTTEIRNSKCINFLDVLVDNSSTTAATTAFLKPTNTGLHSNQCVLKQKHFSETKKRAVGAIIKSGHD